MTIPSYPPGVPLPSAKTKKGDTPSVASAKKKGRKAERNAEDVQHLVSSGSPPVPQEREVTTSGRKQSSESR